MKRIIKEKEVVLEKIELEDIGKDSIIAGIDKDGVICLLLPNDFKSKCYKFLMLDDKSILSGNCYRVNNILSRKEIIAKYIDEWKIYEFNTMKEFFEWVVSNS